MTQTKGTVALVMAVVVMVLLGLADAVRSYGAPRPEPRPVQKVCPTYHHTKTVVVPKYVTHTAYQTHYVDKTSYVTHTAHSYVTKTEHVPHHVTRTVPSYVTKTEQVAHYVTHTVPSYVTKTIVQTLYVTPSCTTTPVYGTGYGGGVDVRRRPSTSGSREWEWSP